MAYPDKEDGQWCNTDKNCVKLRYTNCTEDKESAFWDSVEQYDLCHVGTLTGCEWVLSSFCIGVEYPNCEEDNILKFLKYVYPNWKWPQYEYCPANSQYGIALIVTKHLGVSCDGCGCDIWGVEGSDCCDPVDAYCDPVPESSCSEYNGKRERCAFMVSITTTIDMYQYPGTNVCPPGYYLTHGICCPDGYEYNEETGNCEPNPDDCLRCYGLDDNITACYNTSVWIPINYRDQGVKPNQMTNIPIQISYVGSSGLNGSDFIGPTTVMVDTKSNENGFSVNLLRSMPIGATLCIEFVWEEINCDMFADCNKKICITIEDCDISTQPPGSGGGDGGDGGGGYPGGGLPGEGTYYEDYDCCRYMPKDFIAWADGIGVPVLVPPFLRDGFIYND